MFNFEPAKKPTLYFIGVTTGQSSIMKIFPEWAKALSLDDVEIKGIDLPIHAPAEDYRKVVTFLKNDPLSRGALVTTHKLDLFAACEDLFGGIDPYASRLREVSCLSKRGDEFWAHAKDPISSGLALEHFVPSNFWAEYGGEALLLGAGGSSLAMALYFADEKHGDNKPTRVTLTNRSTPRLESAKKTLSGLDLEIAYAHCATPADNDRQLSALPPYSLIVNATGLGKDAPGSPLTSHARFPEHSLVWEINYRGDLIFMKQGMEQAQENKLYVEDGWIYFIHGWTQVIAEVFQVDLSEELLETLSTIAANI